MCVCVCIYFTRLLNNNRGTTMINQKLKRIKIDGKYSNTHRIVNLAFVSIGSMEECM